MKRNIYEYKAEAIAKLKVLRNALEDCGIECDLIEDDSKNLILIASVASAHNGTATQLEFGACRDVYDNHPYEIVSVAESQMEREAFHEMLNNLKENCG